MDKSILASATSSEDAPTPGYMLNDISRASLSSYQACLQLEDYLVQRLKKPSPIIKYKCLIIIKHVCRTGRPEFKRDMAKHIAAIKECLQFRGSAPDPILGDELNKRVREAAKEAVEAVFDSQMPTPISAVAAANRIQGIGNTSLDEPPAASTSIGFLSRLTSFASQSSVGVDSALVSSIPSETGSGSDYIANNDGGHFFPLNSSTDRLSTCTGGGGRNDDVNSSTGSYSGPDYAGISGATAPLKIPASGMVGLGNPNFKDPRDEKSWVQRAQDAVRVSNQNAGKVLGTMTNAVSAALSLSPAGPTGVTFGGLSNNTSSATRLNEGSSSSSSNHFGGNITADSSILSTFPSNRGANAFGLSKGGFTAPDVAVAFLSAEVAGPASEGNNPLGGSVLSDLPASSSGMVAKTGRAASDGEYEKSLIKSLCDPSGLKPVPPEDVLTTFLLAAPTLSPDIVGACLEQELNSDHWQSRVKALVTVLSLVRAAGCEVHMQWWVSNGLEVIVGLTSDAKASVRSHAVKVMAALGADVKGGGGSSGNGNNINKSADERRKETVGVSFATSGAMTQSSSGGAGLGYENFSLLDLDEGNNNLLNSEPILLPVSNQRNRGESESTVPTTVQSYSILHRQAPPSPVAMIPSSSSSNNFTQSQDMLSFSLEAGRDSQKAELEDIFAGMSLSRPVAASTSKDELAGLGDVTVVKTSPPQPQNATLADLMVVNSTRVTTETTTEAFDSLYTQQPQQPAVGSSVSVTSSTTATLASREAITTHDVAKLKSVFDANDNRPLVPATTLPSVAMSSQSIQTVMHQPLNSDLMAFDVPKSAGAPVIKKDSVAGQMASVPPNALGLLNAASAMGTTPTLLSNNILLPSSGASTLVGFNGATSNKLPESAYRKDVAGNGGTNGTGFSFLDPPATTAGTSSSSTPQAFPPSMGLGTPTDTGLSPPVVSMVGRGALGLYPPYAVDAAVRPGYPGNNSGGSRVVVPVGVGSIGGGSGIVRGVVTSTTSQQVTQEPSGAAVVDSFSFVSDIMRASSSSGASGAPPPRNGSSAVVGGPYKK